MLEREIGAALRIARVEKGLSIAEVSNRLHLKEAYVEAIEEGESEELFPRSYLIGFLRSLARMLDLDVGADIDALSQMLREERELALAAIPLPESGGWRPSRGHFATFAGVLLLLGAVVFFGRSSDAPIATPLTADEMIADLKAQRRLVVAPAPAHEENAAVAVSPVAAVEPPKASPAVMQPPTLTRMQAPVAAAAPAPTPPSTPTAEIASVQTPSAPPAAIPEAAPAAPAVTNATPEPQAAETKTVADRGDEQTKVVVRAVYLRERPTNNSERLGTVARCTRVTVEQVDMRSGWVEISDRSGTGYVHRAFLGDATPACGSAPAEH